MIYGSDRLIKLDIIMNKVIIRKQPEDREQIKKKIGKLVTKQARRMKSTLSRNLNSSRKEKHLRASKY